MSEVVDRRVVSMEMDNEQFKREAEATIKELEKLEKSVDTKGMEKNLSSLEKVSSSINLDGLAKAVDRINYRFSALGTVTDQIFRNLTNSAILAGKRMIKALSTDPLMDGLSEYETEINSVKVIMANLPGITQGEVNEALADLNEYADLTVYNFGQMTDAIGKFTAAGVDLKTSTATIKGLANVAAGAGVSNTRLASAYIQVSQALQAGVFKLMDWNSLQNAGLANEEFRNKLQDTAIEMGILTGRVDNFRDSLQHGWLTTEVFTKTLEKAASTDNEWGKRLTAAATEVTTFTQLIGTLKEGLGTAWSTSIKYILGDFTEAKQLFTFLSDLIGGIISSMSEGRNQALKQWHDLGGRAYLLKSLLNVLAAIYSIVLPIKTAFEDTFETLSGSSLFKITRQFYYFTKSLIQNDDVMNGIYAVAKLLATALKIVLNVAKSGIQILGKILKVVGSVLKAITTLAYYLLMMVDPVSKMIKQSKLFTRLMNAVLKIGDRITNFFGSIVLSIEEFLIYMIDLPMVGDAFELLGSIVLKVADIFVTLVEAVADFDPKNIGKWITDLISKLLSLFNFSKEFTLINNILKGFGATVAGVFIGVIGLVKNLIEVFLGLGSQVKESFTAFDIGQGLATGVISVLTFIINGIRDFARGVKEAMSPENMEAIDWVIGKITDLKDTIVNSVKTIYKELSKLDWNKLFVAAISLILVTSLFNISVGIRSLGEGLESISGSIKSLSSALKKKINPTMTKVQQLTLFITTMVGAIVLLRKIPQKDLDKSMMILTELMGLLIAFEALTLIIDAIAKKLKVSNIKFQLSMASLVGIGVSVAALAASLVILEGVTVDKSLWSKLGVILSLMTTLGVVITVMSRFSGHNMVGFLPILAFVLTLNQVMKAFAEFANTPVDNLKENLQEFIGLMASLAILFVGIGQMKLKGVLALLIFANYITLIIGAFEAIGKANLKPLYEQLTMFHEYIIMLGAFILGVLALTKDIKFGGGLASVGLGILAMAGAIGIILGTYKRFPKDMDEATFVYTTFALGLIFASLVGLVGTIAYLNKEGNSFKGATATLIAISVLLGTMAVVVSLLSLLNDIPSMIAAFGSLSVLMVAIGAMFHSLAKIESGKRSVATLLFITVLIGVLGSTLTSLAGFNWYELLMPTIALGGIITAIGVLAIELVKAFKDVKDKDLKNALKTVVTLTGVFAIIGGVLTLVTKYTDNLWNFLAVSGMLILCVAALSEFAIRLRNGFNGATESQLEKSTKTLFAMTAVFATVGLVIGLLNNFATDSGRMLAQAIMLTAVVGALGELAKRLKDGFSGDIDQNAMNNAYKTMGLLTVIFGAIAGVAYWLQNVSSKRMAVQLGTIIVVVGLLAEVAKKLTKGFTSGDKNIKNAIKTMATLTAVFIAIGATLGVLSNYATEWRLFAGYSAIITAVVGSLAYIAYKLSSSFSEQRFSEKKFKAMIISLGAMTAVFVVLGTALAILNNVAKDAALFVTQAITITAMVGVLSLIVGLLSNFGGDNLGGAAKAMVELSLGITAIAAAFALLGAFNTDIPSIVAMATAITVMTGAFVGLAAIVNYAHLTIALVAIKDFLNGIALSVVSFGVTALMFSGAVWIFSQAIDTLANIGEQRAENVKNSLVKLGEGIAQAIGTIVTSIAMDVVAFVYLLVGNAIAAISDALGEEAEYIAPVFENGIIVGFEKTKQPIYDSAYSVGETATQGFEDSTDEETVKTTAASLPVAYSSGTKMTPGTKMQLINNAKTAAAVYPEQMAKSTKEEMNQYEKEILETYDEADRELMAEAIKNIHEDGLEINENQELVAKDGTVQTTKTIQQYYLDVLDAHDVALADATYSMSDAIKNTGEELKTKAKDAMSTMFSGFLEGLKQKTDDWGIGEKLKEWDEHFKTSDIGEKTKDVGKTIEDSINGLGDSLNNTISGAGGATAAVKEFEDTIVEIPDINDTVNSSMEKFIISFAKAQETIANPNLLPALQSGYNEFIEMQYNTWAATDDGIQTIKEEEEEIARLTEEALEAGVDFDAEAKRTQYRLRDMANAWNELRNTLVDTVQGQIDIFSEFDKKTELSSEQLINNMKSQIEGVKEWADNLTILTQRGLSEGLLQKLSEMGPQGYEYVHAFVEMTADQLNQANQLFAQSTTLSDETADQLLANYVYAGAMTSAGFMQGIVDGQTDVNTACENMGLSGLAALKSVLQIQSPSQETYAVGSYLIQGLVNGITDFQESALITMRELGKALIESMIDGMKYERLFIKTTAEELAKNGYDAISGKWQGYYDAGVYVIQGFIDGMNSKYDDLAAAASALSSLTLGTMSGVLEEASPSRATFKIGSYATEGFVLGINSYVDQVNESTSNLGYIAANNLRNAILSISEGVESDLNMDPTIRPVLDLSRVTPQAQRINAMFSRNLAIKANADVQRAGVFTDSNGTTVAGSQYVFNQYNTSPRALDRVEIYRQTRNQFASFRGMTE